MNSTAAIPLRAAPGKLITAAILVAALLLPAASRDNQASPSTPLVSVIVQEVSGSNHMPERAVEALGGSVKRHLDVIDGFTAVIPAQAKSHLEGSLGVRAVTPDARVRLLQFSDAYDPGNDLGSLYNLTRAIEAPEMWKKGFTGEGVDVALIDSGVTPVNGLLYPGKVINGPDLSFESHHPDLRHLDTFGHGTHMAGVIAARDDAAVPGAYDKKEYLVGAAPDARIVSIKVADRDGATDVSQVIAAIDWVVQHRNDPGMNIRVLNLSFGTDGTQAYTLDPLSYAAEVAWDKGIVVVAAAGNSGFGNSQLNNPAYNPFLIAVGAVKANGTPDTADDTVPDWSSRGDGVRNPDVVAPGRSVSSLRAPGSHVDETNSNAVLHDRFFLGSGTSQAAAAVPGAAALVVQQRPSATPDQIKRLLMTTATPLREADPVAQGSGFINLKSLLEAPTPSYQQDWQRSTGLGSLDLARGSARLSDNEVPLAGEQDIFGRPWNPLVWTQAAAPGTSWSGGLWNGGVWAGDCWCGTSWTGRTWRSDAWTAGSWSGRTWRSDSWTGRTWRSNSWTGRTWRHDVWSSAGYGTD